jgi:hypothetical protein
VTDGEADLRDLSAVEAALGLFSAPDRLGWSRSAALPSGMLTVIRVAAGDASLADRVSVATGEPVDRLVEACTFFVSGVLFDAESDHFRVLGVDRSADEVTLKQHFRWLLKWLHPDRDPESWVSTYADRLSVAWNTLRRSDRRAAYLASLPEQVPGVEAGPSAQAMQAWPVRRSAPVAPVAAQRRRFRIPSRWVHRLPVVAAVSLSVVAATLIVADRVGRDLLDAPPVIAHDDDAAPATSDTGAPDERSGPAETTSGPVEAIAASAAMPSDAAATRTDQPPPPEAGPVAPLPRALADRVDRSPDAAGEPRSLATDTLRPDPAAAAMASAPAVRSADGAGGSEAAAASGPAATRSESTAVPLAVATNGTATSAPEGPTVAASPGSTLRVAVEESAALADLPAVPASPAAAAVAAPSLSARAGVGGLVAASVAAPPADASPSVLGPRASTAAQTPEPVADPALEQQIRVGRRLASDFSEAYRDGDVQRIVVLFTPNARTPEGNLLELHEAYSELFAGSTRRSLEFIRMDWQETDGGLEGRGAFEWAMQPRNGFRVRSSSGSVRILVRFIDGRPLIVELDHGGTG